MNRRFNPEVEQGNTVTATDDVTPHTIESLENGDFIRAREEKPPVVPPENKMVAQPAVPGSEK
ncbi:hypothetical protein [Bradyrhizobium sp. 174]|uniref:hypothetical protein n=1 Tax=Bradyrhizobium sp. 174 TaxID=2782645 RepID=UPI001FF88FBE|nr:hypothetical protein [Bradyrhizobium sp. 174]MCK1577801.1 hypothetical protein [Bradyrhizobium sp. 174]